MRQSMTQLEQFERGCSRTHPPRAAAAGRDQAHAPAPPRADRARAEAAVPAAPGLILLTVVVVTVLMFETLAWLMG
jgi:hypothetical protein